MSQQIIANRYEINELIGRGGMGNVYRGRDTQTGDSVAIKHLKSHVIEENPELIERFNREGKLLRKLDHPNIVTVLATIEEDDNHYIVMEHIGGGSLRDIMEQDSPLPVRHVLEIGLDIADALTRTHRLNIIHRDIKPSNVLMAEDGTPRLTDFGIARGGGDGKTQLTSTGAVLGTYAYLSPEACMGEELDARADIWAFGVMLYEMLTGQRPFEYGHEAATLIAILQEETPDVRQARPDMPEELAILIDHALIKERDQRIPSIRRVGAELEAILFSLDKRSSDGSRFATPSTSSAMPISASRLTRSPTDTAGEENTVLMTETGFGKRTSRWQRFLAVDIFVAFAILVVAVLLFATGILSGDDDAEQQPTAVAVVAPQDSDHYIVLVAQMEPLTSNERDVSRFIVDNLQQKLEREITFSNIRVFAYPGIIRSEAEAQIIAEANNAVVVVWGNYTTDVIELEIQLGATAVFADIPISRTRIQEATNVRVHMENERLESIAPQVLGVIAVLQNASGDGYELSRTVAILAELDVVDAEIFGNSVAAHTHRFFRSFLIDSDVALQEIRAAQVLAAGNPILYTAAASAYMRFGQLQSARTDIEIALRLETSDEWAMPLYLQANDALITNDIDAAIEIYSDIIMLRPDDWFPHNFRGALYYLKADYRQASVDLDTSLRLEPNANFPYLFSVSIALREGRIADAQQLMREVLARFPDPSLGNRTITATYGDQFPIPFGPLFSAFGNLLLGRYEDVITDAEQGLVMDSQIPEIYMLQGLAHCNLDDDESAVDAYTAAIELAPDFYTLYLLRGDARFRADDVDGSNQDAATATDPDNGLDNALMPYLLAGVRGELTCKNFFSYELPEEDND